MPIIQNEDEKQFLLAMLDLAIKYGGLQVAPGCVEMANRVRDYNIKANEGNTDVQGKRIS